MGATSDPQRFQLPCSSHPKDARPEMPEEKSPAALGFAPVSCIVLVRALPAGERWWRWEAEANRGWTAPAERIPGAGCPTAQARYAVGNEEEEDPEARQG